MNIPVDSQAINISEEVNRSGVWKNVNCSNIVNKNTKEKAQATCRNNRRRGK